MTLKPHWLPEGGLKESQGPRFGPTHPIAVDRVRDEERRAAHNGGLSDGLHGEVGSGQIHSTPHRLNEVKPKPNWDYEICRDLQRCYNLSEPTKRGT